MNYKFHKVAILYCLTNILNNLLNKGIGVWLPKPVLVKHKNNDQYLTKIDRLKYDR